MPSHITQGRELSPPLGKRDDAQLFGQSRTLRIKQLLGLDCSMANLDLAAFSTDIVPNFTIFISFRGPAGPAATSCEFRPEHPADSLKLPSS
jgi:hypothetical protein